MKKECLPLFNKNTLKCWATPKTAKVLVTAKQLIRKNSVCYFKNHASFFTEQTYR